MKSHHVTDKWYVVQVFEKGEWIDAVDMDFTLTEARKELCLVNCYGHKARIIERIAAFRVITERDFRGK